MAAGRRIGGPMAGSLALPLRDVLLRLGLATLLGALVGHEADVEVPAADALATAQKLASEKLGAAKE